MLKYTINKNIWLILFNKLLYKIKKLKKKYLINQKIKLKIKTKKPQKNNKNDEKINH